VLASAAIAQTPADVPPEKAAVIANDRAYEAAYAKSDVKALADFFAEDADYTADDGRTFSGREAIEGAIRAAARHNARVDRRYDAAERVDNRVTTRQYNRYDRRDDRRDRVESRLGY
jgi:uncharacterized protein (TIGR02246 family)